MAKVLSPARKARGPLDAPIIAARVLYHRVFGTVLPVTYTSAEILSRRHLLDPEGPRSPEAARDATIERLDTLAEMLAVSVNSLVGYVQEAFEVELTPEKPGDGDLLEPPMSCEDRYVLYTVTRALGAQSAVETGVANGCSSAMILAAMERAGVGRLIGVDHAMEQRDRLGQMIPPRLLARFTLRLGDGVEELERLATLGESIDLFIHDSNHAYRHARREYEIAWRMLMPGGVLCSHDVLHSNAFDRFVSHHRDEIEAATKIVNFGVARKRTPPVGEATRFTR